MAAVTFRAATESDLELLLRFMAALYREDGSTPFRAELSDGALRLLLAAPERGLVRVIEWDGTPAGYVVLTWGYSLEFHGRDAFIDELYVAPEYRGSGLGRQAVAWAETVCRAHGAGALHLEVELDNERAHALYRASGFAERGLRLMTKRLSAVSAEAP
jgi:ribosomal protein S18 acetylase RimI-like enzyme